METLVLYAASARDTRLTLAQICAVARGQMRAALDPASAALIAARRARVVSHVTAHAETPIYGFNRGFGSNVRDAVRPEHLNTLQRNLILSHAVGVGEPAPIDVVRATMLLRAQSLALGHSVVRPDLILFLIAMLNAGVTPLVPRLGSVSASGDLAPLAHIALTMIGEGEAFFGNARMPARDALAKAGLSPIVLEMKEGLALTNGCQYATAWMALATDTMHTLIETAAITTALTGQVMLGADTPFRADLHALRPHPGSVEMAAKIHALFQDSPLRKFHGAYDIDGEVQDPYNLRCAAQILGPCLDLINRAIATLEIEANSVTDNPIDVSALDETNPHDPTATILSGGHFHGMPLAVDAYGLLQAASIMARLTNMRCVRYVDQDRNKGLGPHLKWPGAGSQAPESVAPGRTPDALATESGMLMPEYVTASLANQIWGLAMPSHVMSMSTDSGQEDHVSMAAIVAMRAHEAGLSLSQALAIELAYGAQAAAIRAVRLELRSRALADHPVARPLASDLSAPGAPATLETYAPIWWRAMQAGDARLSAPCEAVLACVQAHFPTVTQDRYMAGELESLARAVRDGAINQAAGIVKRNVKA
jgi:histidine ammonia-lyase